MGPSYSITQNQIDSDQIVPNIIVGFYPFIRHESYYKTQSKAQSKLSASKVGQIIVVSDVMKCQISSSKTSPIHQASVTLSSSQIDYQQRLSPGDYVAIWITTNADQFNKVSNSVLSNKKSNGLESGLKFVGRVRSVSTSMSISQSNGKKVTRYYVSMEGFSELNSQVYFNPYLRDMDETEGAGASSISSDAALRNFWDKTINAWTSIVRKGATPVDKLIPFFIDAFLGEGPMEESTIRGGTIRSPNSTFVIPNKLANIFGIKAPSNHDTYSFADLLHTIIGVQSYSNSSNNIKNFIPRLKKSASGGINRQLCDVVIDTLSSPEGATLYGDVFSLPDPFNNTSVWGLITSHSNPELNEVYTALKPNRRGELVPTLIARQIPFSSIYVPKVVSSEAKYTKFVDLPRWDIDPSMITSYEVGTSDAARINFVQFYGAMNELRDGIQGAMTQQISLGNLSIDMEDIFKSGPRIKIIHSNIEVSDAGNLKHLKDWAKILGDIYINGHLKLSGRASLRGVSEPITHGDNCVIDGKLFHIESVSHSYEVSEFDGRKSFSTSLAISGGVLEDGSYAIYGNTDGTRESLNLQSDLFPGYTDEEIYINNKQIRSEDIE